MKDPMKPRDKITQKMSRDGLTEQNQTTGESELISKRIQDADFQKTPEQQAAQDAAQLQGAVSPSSPLPHAPEHFSKPQDAAAERVMEHIGAGQTRKASKKAVRRAQEAAASKAQPSRLQFTDEERATPELEKYIKKSDKAVWTQRGRHFPQRRNRGCNLTSRKRRRASRASAIPYPAPRRKPGFSSTTRYIPWRKTIPALRGRTNPRKPPSAWGNTVSERSKRATAATS